MRRRILRQTDVETGEVRDGLVMYLPPKKQNGFKRWLAMAQEELLDTLMQFKHLDDCRVLFALLKHVEYENRISVSQADISRLLSMAAPQVNRAIKRLLESGVILKEPKRTGTNCYYHLSPEFGWKGSSKNHVKARREYQESQRKTAAIANVPEQKAQ
jgi:predicted transcriptional regulator